MAEPVTLSRILEEFQRYRETADFLAQSRDKNIRCYPRGQETSVEAKGELADLLRTFALLLERTRKRKPMLLTRDDWTIEDATDWLHQTLTECKSFSFFTTMRERRSSVFDMLVLFLAVLEQLRLNKVRVSQPQPFADFTVEVT
jgi:chromatin segregation and condensation protein Rec8/ScpA/Scc1 (kleisin family)